MTVAKILDDPRDDLPHLVVGKPADALEQMHRAIFASREEGSRDHPAVVADKPDRQTLDGKRCAVDHQSMTAKQAVVVVARGIS
jgi:hypothetical protein